MKKNTGPRVLFLDIETAPLLGYCWAMFDQNIGLNQLKSDWYCLSYSAKWLGSNEMFYMDQRNEKNLEDDSKLLKGIWKLLDEADVVIGHNSKRFDTKKLNARFILNGMKPPSSYKQIDTLSIARKHFAFTSNKLEYLSAKLCTKYKKYTNRKYSGFSLWTACLAKNQEAWKEMEKYNKYDVLSLEELYNILLPWDNTINFNLYYDEVNNVCNCGNKTFKKNGFYYTKTGQFQRYSCKKCGHEVKDRNNLFSKEKKKSLRSATNR